MTMADPIIRARSLLFVPGHRPDRFRKAAASGADEIALDLEDAVGPGSKSIARQNVADWLALGGTGVVRINGACTDWYEDDVAMLEGRRCVVILPKATSASQIYSLLDRLTPGSCVVPLLETASGILGAQEICSAHGVIRAIFGNGDLACELGIDHSDLNALARARSEVVLASAACGLGPPLDGLTTAIADEQKLLSDAKHAAALGFGGKVCIHPLQIHAVHEIFTPSSEDLRTAREVLEASSDGTVTLYQREVIGTPVVERARRLLMQWVEADIGGRTTVVPINDQE